MIELSEVCNSYTGPPLTPSAVKVGNMYAARYDDGRWYRYVLHIQDKTTYLFSCEELTLICNNFSEHTFPKSSVKMSVPFISAIMVTTGLCPWIYFNHFKISSMIYHIKQLRLNYMVSNAAE